MSHYLEVTINKPLYGNYVYIRESIIKRAMIEGKWLRITVPNGVGVISPLMWKNGAKKMEKKFNYNTPMVLYGNTVPLNHENKALGSSD